MFLKAETKREMCRGMKEEDADADGGHTGRRRRTQAGRRERAVR